nr:helix-turn-helix transcriptional regulator [uncultured Anaerostipes sp.]
MLTKIIAELMVHSSYDVKESCRIYLPEVNAALSTQEDEETDYSKFYLFCKKYQLTTREQDILKLLLDDMNNTEISETLCISVGTTKAHIHNIFAKVDVKRRRDLMQIYEKYTASTEDE